MSDDLEAATGAYREARAAVIDAARNLSEAKADVPRAREALAQAIVAAARAGMRQVDIVKVTGYQREQVRRILRRGGVDPDD